MSRLESRTYGGWGTVRVLGGEMGGLRKGEERAETEMSRLHRKAYRDWGTVRVLAGALAGLREGGARAGRASGGAGQ